MSDISLITPQLQDRVLLGSDIKDLLIEIAAIASSSLENQIFLGNQALPTILLDILSKQPYDQDHDTCDLVFAAIIRLCRRGVTKDTMYAPNCDLVLCNRGGKQILDSLANFILELNHIIGTACHLIMILGADSQDRQRLLAEEGVSVALAAVLFQYSTDDYAAEMGSRAVRNLATEDEVAAALISEGIAEALVKVVKENESVIVLEQSLWAVVNLACDGRIATIIGSAGVFDPLVKVMDQHVDHVGIVEAGAFAIRNLLSDSEMNMSQVVKNSSTLPMIPVVMKCLSLHRAEKNHNVCEVLLWAAANLASCNELGAILFAEDIMSCLLAIYHTLSLSIEHDADLIEAATWLVRNMINSVPGEAEVIYHTGIINITVSHLHMMSKDQESLSYISLDVVKSILVHLPADSMNIDAVMQVIIDPVMQVLYQLDVESSVRIAVDCLQIVGSVVKLRKESSIVMEMIAKVHVWLDSEVMVSLSTQYDKVQEEALILKDLLK